MTRCAGEGNSSGEPTQGGRVWAEADGVHIDVRDLPPPGPFVAILRLVESDRHQGLIIAHLPRDPLPLYPELAERGWSATRLEGGAEGEVTLRLSRIEG